MGYPLIAWWSLHIARLRWDSSFLPSNLSLFFPSQLHLHTLIHAFFNPLSLLSSRKFCFWPPALHWLSQRLQWHPHPRTHHNRRLLSRKFWPLDQLSYFVFMTLFFLLCANWPDHSVSLSLGLAPLTTSHCHSSPGSFPNFIPWASPGASSVPSSTSNWAPRLMTCWLLHTRSISMRVCVQDGLLDQNWQEQKKSNQCCH